MPMYVRMYIGMYACVYFFRLVVYLARRMYNTYL